MERRKQHNTQAGRALHMARKDVQARRAIAALNRKCKPQARTTHRPEYDEDLPGGELRDTAMPDEGHQDEDEPNEDSVMPEQPRRNPVHRIQRSAAPHFKNNNGHQTQLQRSEAARAKGKTSELTSPSRRRAKDKSRKMDDSPNTTRGGGRRRRVGLVLGSSTILRISSNSNQQHKHSLCLLPHPFW